MKANTILDKNLIKLCKEWGIPLTELAKQSGVKQPTLHGWTTGRSVQNLDDLVKVCNFFKISLYGILYGKADPWGEPCEICETRKK